MSLARQVLVQDLHNFVPQIGRKPKSQPWRFSNRDLKLLAEHLRLLRRAQRLPSFYVLNARSFKWIENKELSSELNCLSPGPVCGSRSWLWLLSSWKFRERWSFLLQIPFHVPQPSTHMRYKTLRAIFYLSLGISLPCVDGDVRWGWSALQKIKP